MISYGQSDVNGVLVSQGGAFYVALPLMCFSLGQAVHSNPKKQFLDHNQRTPGGPIEFSTFIQSVISSFI